jgi:hypothetical protein
MKVPDLLLCRRLITPDVSTSSVGRESSSRDAGRAACKSSGRKSRGRAPPATTNRFACVSLITELCRRRRSNDPPAVARAVWSHPDIQVGLPWRAPVGFWAAPRVLFLRTQKKMKLAVCYIASYERDPPPPSPRACLPQQQAGDGAAAGARSASTAWGAGRQVDISKIPGELVPPSPGTNAIPPLCVWAKMQREPFLIRPPPTHGPLRPRGGRVPNRCDHAPLYISNS